MPKLTEAEVRDLVKANNRSRRLSDDFLVCLIYKECKFSPRRNDTGSSAAGIMQIMPSAVDEVNKTLPAGQRFKHSDISDNARCIQVATLYLDIRIRWAGGDVTAGVNGYGTGAGYADGILACEACMRKTPLGGLTCLLKVDW